MDPKLLTEDGWKAVALKAKIKDNSLQRALSVYEKVPDNKPADRLKANRQERVSRRNHPRADHEGTRGTEKGVLLNRPALQPKLKPHSYG